MAVFMIGGVPITAPVPTKVQLRALTRLGVDRNDDHLLDASEWNDAGKAAAARGFVDKETNNITPELAVEAVHELDGRFQLDAALREAGRGLQNGFASLAKRPLRSLVVLGATLGAVLLVPQAGLVISTLVGAVSLKQLARGGMKVARAIQKGDGDLAETAFRDLGAAADPTGISSTLEIADSIADVVAKPKDEAPPTSTPPP